MLKELLKRLRRPKQEKRRERQFVEEWETALWQPGVRARPIAQDPDSEDWIAAKDAGRKVLISTVALKWLRLC